MTHEYIVHLELYTPGKRQLRNVQHYEITRLYLPFGNITPTTVKKTDSMGASLGRERGIRRFGKEYLKDGDSIG